MISISQYVGPHADSPDWTPERQQNAKALLYAVDAIEEEMTSDTGYEWPINPKTGSQVSGETFGGFRPQSCPIGAPHSNHKEGNAVDVYDPANRIDAWCNANPFRLEAHGLYMEAKESTLHWAHFSRVPPASGKRFFVP